MAKPLSYNKTEKLKSRKLMEQVFAKGKSFSMFPIKVFYLQVTEQLDFPVKVGVGVSSRNFKKAVHRNRIKRLLRESYRINKHPLHDAVKAQNENIAVFLLFLDKQLPSYEIIQAKMPLVIEKLSKAIQS